MIEIRALCKRFGPILAVDSIDLAVARGEVLGFLGPNGAGKSTTMKMVAGFLTPTSGTAIVAGHDVVRDPLAVKRAMGYLPEGAPAYPDMTPLSFLRFVAATRGLRGRARRDAVRKAADRVQLAGVMRQPIDTLSKGYKRRVGLAQALLHEPRVLILDEPTDGLDPNQKHEVRGLIRSLGEDRCVVLSTHILEEVDAVCTRAVIIARGKLLADDTPAGLLARSSRPLSVVARVSGTRAAELPAALRKLGAVALVETDREMGGETITAVPMPGVDAGELVAAVAGAVSGLGLTVGELRVDRGRFDEVFREITTGQRAGSRAGSIGREPAEGAA